jgi:hypothetical protein
MTTFRAYLVFSVTYSSPPDHEIAFSESNHREVVGWGLEGLGEVETPWLRDDDEGGEKRWVP